MRRPLPRVFVILLLALAGARSVDACCTSPSFQRLAHSSDELLIAEVEAQAHDAGELHSHLLLRTVETFKGSPPERQWVEYAYGAEGPTPIRGDRYFVALRRRAAPLVFNGGSASRVLDACEMLPMRSDWIDERLRSLRRWGFFWEHIPAEFFERRLRDGWLTLAHYGDGPDAFFRVTIEPSGQAEFATSERVFTVSLSPADLAQLRAISHRDQSTIGGKYGDGRETRYITIDGVEVVTIAGPRPPCDQPGAAGATDLWNQLLTATGSVARTGTDLRLPPCRPGGS